MDFYKDMLIVSCFFTTILFMAAIFIINDTIHNN